MPVELAPKGDLRIVESATRYVEAWWAGTFPVAYGFDHADVEYQSVEHFVAEVEVQEGAPLDEGGGAKKVLADGKLECYVQPLVVFVPVVVAVLHLWKPEAQVVV